MRRAEPRLVVAMAALLAACTAPESDPPSATECVSCHVEDYERADPVHVGVRPDTCGVCHTQTGWHPDVLQHEWELTGAHHDTACFDCHDDTPPVFDGTPTDCFSCHEDDEAHTLPAHHTFGTACASCHTTTAWRPSTHHPAPAVVDAGPPDAGEGAPDAGEHDAGRVRRPPATRVRRPPPSTTPPPSTIPPPTTVRPPPTTTPPDTTTSASRRY